MTTSSLHPAPLVDRPGDRGLAECQVLLLKTLISHPFIWIELFHVLWFDVLTNCSIIFIYFLQSFKDLEDSAVGWGFGNSCWSWMAHKMFQFNAMILVFLALGCDKNGLTIQILLNECGFLKFIEHSITFVWALNRRWGVLVWVLDRRVASTCLKCDVFGGKRLTVQYWRSLRVYCLFPNIPNLLLFSSLSLILEPVSFDSSKFLNRALDFLFQNSADMWNWNGYWIWNVLVNLWGN